MLPSSVNEQCPFAIIILSTRLLSHPLLTASLTRLVSSVLQSFLSLNMRQSITFDCYVFKVRAYSHTLPFCPVLHTLLLFHVL